MMTARTLRTAVFALAAVLAIGAGLGGCSRACTDILLRDAADHQPLVGVSVGQRGPLHMAYRWSITDTDGAARLRTKNDWSTLSFVVAGTGHRIDARGVLTADSDQWVLLEAEPKSPRRIEARIGAGEGAPVATVNQTHD